jgi:hypothetical protein
MFESSVAGLVKMNEEGHDFAGMHLIRMMARSFSISDQSCCPRLTMLLPKIIDITKQFEYAHRVTS